MRQNIDIENQGIDIPADHVPRFGNLSSDERNGTPEIAIDIRNLKLLNQKLDTVVDIRNQGHFSILHNLETGIRENSPYCHELSVFLVTDQDCRVIGHGFD